MSIAGIISLVATVASILLIIFKIKTSVGISLRSFLILLVIICFLVLILDNALGDDNKSDAYPQDTETMEDTSDDAQPASTPEDSRSSEDTEPLLSEDPEDESELPDGIQVIEPLVNKEYHIDPIEESSLEIPPNEIIKLADEIVSEEQVIEYEYTPSITGTYRFEFSDVPHGTYLRLDLYNSGKEMINAQSSLDNGDGITQFLNSGESYYIDVKQYKEIGPYVLNIGQQKEIRDISNYTAVSDSIQYTEQQNDYLYTPKNNGLHRFEFSNVPNGTDLNLTLFNSGWEIIENNANLDNGEGISYSLSVGESYYIRVKQYQNIGPYTLNVGPKKEIKNIDEYTMVSDTVQYTDQTNSYSFTPVLEGTHRFEFSNVPNGTDFILKLFNSGWEEIESEFNLDNGDGITQGLVAGETYYISVVQYKGVGQYTLNIGKKKPAPDISSCLGVSDSIQYTDQKNDYLFTPKADGEYRFILSDIPAGNKFELIVCNSGWEKLSSSYNSVDVSLSKGETYYVQVRSIQGSIGDYCLTVEY